MVWVPDALKFVEPPELSDQMQLSTRAGENQLEFLPQFLDVIAEIREARVEAIRSEASAPFESHFNRVVKQVTRNRHKHAKC